MLESYQWTPKMREFSLSGAFFSPSVNHHPPLKCLGAETGEGGAKRLPFVSQRKEGTHLMMTHLEKAAFYILPHCTVLPTISSNLPRDTPAESLRCHVAIHSSTTQLTGFWPLDLIGRGSRIGPKLPKAAFFFWWNWWKQSVLSWQFWNVFFLCFDPFFCALDPLFKRLPWKPVNHFL